MSPCCMIVCHWITRVVTRNGSEFWEWSCILPSLTGQTLTGQTLTQATLNSEKPASVFCIHFRKEETAQQSCYHCTFLCCTLVPVYLPNISPCDYLQTQLTCHNKFYEKVVQNSLCNVQEVLGVEMGQDGMCKCSLRIMVNRAVS